ncbi:1-acyl-sn-glycerol-3-phosphate acyltransferase [Nocardia sp. NPDC051030]|uniref:1-acyl-sn-glycerol-3-phosphate acyltransferase n=1 Tax=Nocardia sp. NPDC051030 TaxID=3155162 RepID=UPI003443076C
MVRVIRSGPQGPTVAAVFDFDALICRFRGVRSYRKVGRGSRRDRRLAASLLEGVSGERSAVDIEQMERRVRRTWCGHAESELDDIGRRLFRQMMGGHLYMEVWPLVRAHENAGHTVVLVSTLTRFHVQEAADQLGISHIVCTQLQSDDGTLTGRLAGPVLHRDEKVTAVKQFAAAHEVGTTLGPAVFIFNHQSNADFVILAHLFRHLSDAAILAKREINSLPVIGSIFRTAGATFIDRDTMIGRMAGFRRMIEALREGRSAVIAPEGTTTYTARPAPFHHGAFRMAMAARVPIVPVVLRNVGEVAWLNSSVIRSGTVDVAVLNP